ncbi:MAG: hypothetical protein AAF543_13825 [Pseudomonadota bacterium]
MFCTKTVLSCAAVVFALSAQQAAAVPYTLEQTVNNPGPGSNSGDLFGFSTSLSNDGSRALVGAAGDGGNNGTAYVIDTSTGGLLQTLNNPTNGSDLFGYINGVSLSGDGSTALVGAFRDSTTGNGSGTAYVFDATTGNLLQTLNNPTPGSGDGFGISVSLSDDGSTALVGAYTDDATGINSGTAYIFDVSTGNLLQTLNNPTPGGGDLFGFSVSLSGDGSTALVGALNSDATYAFDVSTGNLLQTLNNPTPGSGDRFGYSVSLSGDGSTALVGAYGDTSLTGVAYTFDVGSGNLLQTLGNPGPNDSDYFGVSVALSDDGGTALIGALGDTTQTIGGSPLRAGSAYLFDAANGAFLQALNNPTPAQFDNFGYGSSLSADGRTALVGAYLDDTGANNAGSAYVYRDQAVDLPAPGSLLLLGSTLAVMAGLRLRRRRQGEG